MVNEEPTLCALCIFLGASALVVIGFAGYQSYLSGVAGMTTNELAKWGRLEGRLENGESFITKTYVGDQITEEDKKIQQQHQEKEKEKKEKEQKDKKANEDGVRNRKGNKDQETEKDKASSLNMDEYYDGMIKNGYRYTTISKSDDIENQYNYGILKNFKEIFFPREDIF
ncbi:hypothetical protein PIROE2DRAFT_61794 [Piromyces sp. E2]|nr:hypothetical protein PIROE2DRAFT_61794 [Piromyces sp. E2]|eukprot:OUM62572.1 hypothetical protein PIROE2DRAFT_61794 [Piromyces sp. E2]